MDECLGAVHNPNQLVPTSLGRHNDANSGSRKLAVPKQNRFNMPAAPNDPAAPAAPEASNSNWDGVERRKSDQGPPKGQADRRRPHMPFGRRHLA